ncbi:MAG: MBL fold metallo-hydrolase [Leptospira sp.]|nr:MBL fold metallo-hydrolase [Leptospira sp.]NCS95181.1 MBL fold metallo-hydrolase [Leptospira sp.]
MRNVLFIGIVSLMISCSVTSNASVLERKGQKATISLDEFKKVKSKLEFQKITAADWEVDRAGLIDLSDPKSKAAGLSDETLEPIQIYFYTIDHPTAGKFIIDTGLADLFKKDPSEWPISSLVASAMNTDKLTIKVTLGEWLKKQNKPINGAFLTHMHMDHIMGTSDLSDEVPIYTGPNEPTAKNFLNLFVKGTTDNLLGENKILRQLEFSEVNTEFGLATLDLFEDGSFLVFHSPGHTPGSLAFLIKAKDGIHLVLGDTSHTKFGWEQNVTPGSFTSDREENRRSLNALQDLAKKIPGIQVHPGHQSL